MKIAYILRTRLGAMGEAASYHYATLTAKHHDVLVLAPHDPGAQEKLTYPNVDITVCDIYDPELMGQVNKTYGHLKRFCPDIIHMIQSPLCFYYPFYLQHLFPHSKWLIDFRSPHVGARNSPALKRYFWLQFFVDKVLTHSHASLKTNIPILFRRPVELPPGVDLKLFNKVDLDSPRHPPRKYVFISSINRTRKIDFLVSAFSKFAKKSNFPVTLDIFGDGNAREQLIQCILERQASRFISFHGKIPQAELIQKLPGYDAGIAYVPYENFSSAPSIKSLEYAAAGIPILASDTEGHKEYNQMYGFKYQLFENSTDSFVQTLNQVALKGFSKEHVQTNYRAVQLFDWETIVYERLLPIYKKLQPSK